MLFYNRESNFEGIDVNRNSEPVSKECSFCHFNFFKDRNFLHQYLVCNESHDVSLHAISSTDIKFITNKGNIYRVVSKWEYSESYR